MGKMSFPENEARPSRTIMATRSASTREALIYKSEYNRKGDGEYRTPTIREAATLMGFPWYYQFTGSEGSKWKQIGNAVCPHMSAALAKRIRELMKLRAKAPAFFELKRLVKVKKLRPTIQDLNSDREKVFNAPPTKKKGGKFRRHMFKSGNLTIGLVNYCPEEEESKRKIFWPEYFSEDKSSTWYAAAFLGSGKKYRVQRLSGKNLKAAKAAIKKAAKEDASELFDSVGEIIDSALYKKNTLENSPYSFPSAKGIGDPFELVDKLANTISEIIREIAWEKDKNGEMVPLETLTSCDIVDKPLVPLEQICAVFALCEVVRRLAPTAWKEIRAVECPPRQLVLPV